MSRPDNDTILNVILGRWSDQCRIMGKPVRGCRRRGAFMVCGGDGKPKLSRLEASVCPRHLPLAIRRIRRASS